MTTDTTLGRRPAWSFTRLFTNPTFHQYRQLAALVALVNFGLLVHGLSNDWWWDEGGPRLERLADMALVNLSLAALIRQQHVINLLFWLATRIPTSWPLSIRWTAAKVYHFGGLHMGGAVVGSLWLAAFTAGVIWLAAQDRAVVSNLTIAASLLLVGLLSAMIGTALGPIRARFHDLFERTHRFAGWAVLAALWVQSISFLLDRGAAVLEAPAFWALGLVTLSILLPWLRLKKVPIEVVKPSGHAVVVRFDYGDDAFPGSSNAISRSPLLEWHSFASIPAPGQRGYRLIISRAGDWTGKFIDDCPGHVWVKGITTSGVARIEVLFKRVVYVATGSGIGPVMPHLLAKQVPIHLIWATRSPRETYGDALVAEILEACPDAQIWNTDRQGKPDLAALAIAAVRGFEAEAVICISNKRLTWDVVGRVEREGIPAYGAIWDS